MASSNQIDDVADGDEDDALDCDFDISSNETFDDKFDRGMSVEEFLKAEAEGFDTSTKWVEMKNTSDTKATIGVAFDAAWNQAKKEFEFIRDKMGQHCGSRRPNFEAIFDLIFGSESEIFRAFEREGIFDSYEAFLQFLAAFFLSSSHQVSTKMLFEKHSRIKMDGAMGKDDCINHWKRIGSASLPSKQKRNRTLAPTGMVPFWMKLEAAVNNCSREAFISNFPGDLQVTLDDDKPHAAGNRCTAGLKLMRHVKDNVNGHTLHTLVLSCSQVPAQVSWEREMNDSLETATERIFGNGITPMAAPGQPGDLRHISTGKDQGNWTKGLLHDYFMRSGARIKAATTKRQPCIAFTYGQKLADKDTRTDVPAAGPKTLFIKEMTSHRRKLYCFAYRNGNGGVILGMSTEHGMVPEWELVVDKPQDLKWYDDPNLSEDDRISKSFHCLRLQFDGNPKQGIHIRLDGDFLDAIKDLSIRALTTTQGTPEWFMLRRFALTSTTTDKAIAVCKGNEDWLEHTAAWTRIKNVLRGIVTDDANSSDEDSNGDGNEDAQSETSDANTNGVELTLEGLLQSDDMIQTARHQIAFDEVNVGQVRNILKALGKNLSSAKDDNKRNENDLKSFRIFLEADDRFRQYVFKSKKDLVAIALQLGIDDQMIGSTQESARNAIEEFLQEHPDVFVTQPKPKSGESKTKERSRHFAGLSTQQKLLHSVIDAGFLDPLKGGARKCTRRGHQLERHIMRACIRELQLPDTKTPLRLISACTAPLVESTINRYARASINFLALAFEDGDDDDDDKLLIGVEIKARVANRTDQESNTQVSVIRRLLGGDRMPRQRKKKHFEVRADSENFAKMVNNMHEAVQLLHHASVYNLQRVLLLVGDNTGAVTYGIFVFVPVQLRAAYNNVLGNIYSSTIKWMHDDDAEKPSDKELQKALACTTVNGAVLDRHSFDMDVALWQDINFNIDFPIPRLRHIIPLVFAYWNALKGGSDATTNLIWHCQYSVPNSENQSIAVARMLSLASVHVHRLSQIATAKENLDFCSCLKQFRDSATERTSFKKSQFMIINNITSKFLPADDDGAAVATPPQQAVAQGAAAAVARAMRSQADVERINLPLFQTNKTPQRNVALKLKQLEGKLASKKIDADSKLALIRSRACTGLPLKQIGDNGDINGKGSRGHCACCGAQTHMCCLLCKQWLCDKPSDAALALPNWKRRVEIAATGNMQPIHFERTCFYEKHKTAAQASVQNLHSKLAAMKLMK